MRGSRYVRNEKHKRRLSKLRSGRGRKRRGIPKFAGFLLPGFAGVCLFYLFPFMETVRRSFIQSASGRFTGIENYRQVLKNQAFWLAVKNTGVFIGAGVPVLMLLSFAAALLLRKALGSRKLMSAMLIPMAIPAAVMVLILQLLTDRNGLWNGLISGLSQYIPFLPFGIHTDYMNSEWAVLIILISFWWKNTGYMTVLWLTGLSALPKELEEAASVDGAGKWKRLIYIIVPQLAGSFFTIFLLSMLQAFKSYREIWMAAGNYPQENIYLLQHLLQNWYLKLEFDRMAALTVMLSLLLLLLCFFLQKRLERN